MQIEIVTGLFWLSIEPEKQDLMNMAVILQVPHMTENFFIS
jgi:hypothetical protein